MSLRGKPRHAHGENSVKGMELSGRYRSLADTVSRKIQCEILRKWFAWFAFCKWPERTPNHNRKTRYVTSLAIVGHRKTRFALKIWCCIKFRPSMLFVQTPPISVDPWNFTDQLEQNLFYRCFSCAVHSTGLLSSSSKCRASTGICMLLCWIVLPIEDFFFKGTASHWLKDESRTYWYAHEPASIWFFRS